MKVKYVTNLFQQGFKQQEKKIQFPSALIGLMRDATSLHRTGLDYASKGKRIFRYSKHTYLDVNKKWVQHRIFKEKSSLPALLLGGSCVSILSYEAKQKASLFPVYKFAHMASISSCSIMKNSKLLSDRDPSSFYISVQHMIA